MRSQNEIYSFGRDVAKQREFDAAIRRLIEDTDFTVFGVGIRKNDFQGQFADTGINHYLLTDVYAVAIVLLMERHIDYMATAKSERIGRITLESQGHAKTLTTRWNTPACSYQVHNGRRPQLVGDWIAICAETRFGTY